TTAASRGSTPGVAGWSIWCWGRSEEVGMSRNLLRSQGSLRALGLLCTWVMLFLGLQAPATTIDTRPRPAVLLRTSEQFIVQSAWNQFALYQSRDGKLLRTFAVPESIARFDVSADENLLLIASDPGTIGVWNINTGEQLWQKHSAQTGLQYTYDA